MSTNTSGLSSSGEVEDCLEKRIEVAQRFDREMKDNAKSSLREFLGIHDDKNSRQDNVEDSLSQTQENSSTLMTNSPVGRSTFPDVTVIKEEAKIAEEDQLSSVISYQSHGPINFAVVSTCSDSLESEQNSSDASTVLHENLASETTTQLDIECLPQQQHGESPDLADPTTTHVNTTQSHQKNEQKSTKRQERCVKKKRHNFKCICGLICASPRALRIHNRLHSGKKPFTCDVCDKEFTCSGKLAIHKRKHTGEKSFKCYVCDMKFTTSTCLAAHKKTHIEKNYYKCDLCDEKFATGHSLSRHKRAIHGNKPLQCAVCEQKFIHPNDFAGHMKTHKEGDLFKCETCKRYFKYPSQLRNHKTKKRCVDTTLSEKEQPTCEVFGPYDVVILPCPNSSESEQNMSDASSPLSRENPDVNALLQFLNITPQGKKLSHTATPLPGRKTSTYVPILPRPLQVIAPRKKLSTYIPIQARPVSQAPPKKKNASDTATPLPEILQESTDHVNTQPQVPRVTAQERKTSHTAAPLPARDPAKTTTHAVNIQPKLSQVTFQKKNTPDATVQILHVNTQHQLSRMTAQGRNTPDVVATVLPEREISTYVPSQSRVSQITLQEKDTSDAAAPSLDKSTSMTHVNTQHQLSRVTAQARNESHTPTPLPGRETSELTSNRVTIEPRLPQETVPQAATPLLGYVPILPRLPQISSQVRKTSHSFVPLPGGKISTYVPIQPRIPQLTSQGGNTSDTATPLSKSYTSHPTISVKTRHQFSHELPQEIRKTSDASTLLSQASKTTTWVSTQPQLSQATVQERKIPDVSTLLHTSERTTHVNPPPQLFHITAKESAQLQNEVQNGTVAAELAKPQQTCNLESKPRECDVYGKICKSATNLLEHEGSHSHLFQCCICGETFERRRDFGNHKRTHEPKISCSVCGKTFTYSNALRKHERDHKRATKKLLECDLCEKKFVYTDDFHAHRRTHTGEKPFSCDECEKTFRSYNGLLVHERKHARERALRCDVCEKQFSSKSRLLGHKRTHTSERKVSSYVPILPRLPQVTS